MAEGEARPLLAHPGLLGEQSRDKSEHVTDEVVNSATALIGFLLSVLGTAVLVTRASMSEDAWAITGCAIYGFTLMLLFAASTLHHIINASPAVEKALRLLDYCAIFPLIAGTVTPFVMICARHEWWAWCVFGTAWLICFGGILMFVCLGVESVPKWLSNTLFIGMGWIAGSLALEGHTFTKCAGVWSVVLIALGGVIYTGGGIMFYLEKPNPVPGVFGFHEMWHCCVFAGAFTHWLSVYLIVRDL